MKLRGLASVALLGAVVLYVGSASPEKVPARTATGSVGDVPLKDAKLNIEHNATDKDTGFQGFIDSEGWRRLEVRGPSGDVLAFEGRGSLGQLGGVEVGMAED